MRTDSAGGSELEKGSAWGAGVRRAGAAVGSSEDSHGEQGLTLSFYLISQYALAESCTQNHEVSLEQQRK